MTVVAVLPNDTQLEGTSVAAGTRPVQRSDLQEGGTYADAVHDYLLPLMKYYETWGRDIDVKFVTSSGSDEAAQRADSVKIKAMKPFAVMDLVTAGLDVLDAEMAKAKIFVYGDATTTEKALAQAPYRWGLSDAQSAAANAAEVIGKQLVGKKAQFAGDDSLQTQTRKFGIVYIPTLVDVDRFTSTFEKYGGKLTTDNPYTSNGTTFGDDTAGPGTGTDDRHEDEEQRRDDRDHGLGHRDEQGDDGAGHEAGVVPRVVPHRRGVPGHRDLRPCLSDRAGCAHVRRVEPRAVRAARPHARAAGEGAVGADPAARVVLGRGRGNAGDVGGAARPRVADARHPHRGAQPHAEDVPAGTVLDPGDRWRGVGIHDGSIGGLREDAGTPLRRVHGPRPRLRAGVVGRGDHRTFQRNGRRRARE